MDFSEDENLESKGELEDFPETAYSRLQWHNILG
jgi:hypothetical protein